MPFRLTATVKSLLILNFVIFILQQSLDQYVFGAPVLQNFFALVPQNFVFDLYLWQIVTYTFLHGDVMHLFLNCLMLFFIGGELEATWGMRKFLIFYFFCGICAGLIYLFAQIFVTNHLHVPMVGASGSIYGLLMAYGLIFSERTLLFMFVFPMKAKHFVWILAGIEFMSTMFSHHSGGLSSLAHLGGMGAGLAYLWGGAWLRVRKKMAANRPKKRRRENHLKLVVDNNEDGVKKKLDEIINDDQDDEDPRTWH